MKLIRMIKNNWLDAVIAVVLFFLAVIMLYPLMETIATSLSTPLGLTMKPTMMWWPIQFSTAAYERIFEEADIITGYKNTLWIIGVGVPINLVMSLLLAYFWSRRDYNVKLKPVIVMFVFLSMYVGGTLVSNFLLIRALGMYGSKWALVIPIAISTYNSILLRTYMQGLGDSLEDSVFLDGGGHFTLLFRIYAPLCKPSLAVIGMYYALDYWSDWYRAKLYLLEFKNFPLALILRLKMMENQIVSSNQTYEAPYLFEELNDTLSAALCVASTLPFMLIYPALQKQFEGGLMVGSLKG